MKMRIFWQVYKPVSALTIVLIVHNFGLMISYSVSEGINHNAKGLHVDLSSVQTNMVNLFAAPLPEIWFNSPS